MNTSNKQEFWENLMLKYADRNKELEGREEHLRARIEAMQALIDSGQGGGNEKCPCDPSPGGFFSCLKKAWGGSPPKSKVAESKSKSKSDVAKAVPESPPPPVHQPEFRKAIPAGKPSNRPSSGAPSNPECVCNPCPEALKAMQELQSSYTKNPNCSCNPCPLDELLMQQELQMADNTSLNSMDLFYMQNVKEMAQNYKNLNQKVKTFEHKEQAFQDVLKEFASMNTDNICPCNTTKRRDDFEKRCADLQLENFLLKNELKEMRLEIRQYMERMEAPMLFKIESERYKNHQLEMKLEEATMDIIKQAELHEKEMNKLKMDLCSANAKNYCLDEQCEELKKEVADVTEQITKLSEDLVRQKISDAETMKRMKDEIEKLRKQLNTPQKDCDLYQLARELSGDLKECEPCKECAAVPSDITATVRHIKELTDAVNERFPESDPNEASNELDTPGPDTDTEVEERGGGEAPPEVQVISPAKSSPRNTQPKTATCTCADPHSKRKLPPCTCIERSENVKIPCAERDPCLYPKNICPCPLPPQIGCGGSPPPKPQLKPPCSCLESRPPPPLPPAEVIPEKIALENKPPKPQLSPQLSPQLQSSCICSCICSEPSVPPLSSAVDCCCNAPKNRLSCLIPKSPSVSRNVALEELCRCLMKDTESEAGLEPVMASKSEGLKIAHNVTASRSRDLIKSVTSVKAMKISKNFPLQVDTTVDLIDKPPDGVHVTTTVTQSGTLLVVTEGPEGIIETNLVYNDDGDVEVVTEILDYKAAGIGKKKAVPAITGGNASGNVGDKVGDNTTLNVSKCLEQAMNKKQPAVKAPPPPDNCACDPNCPKKDGLAKDAAAADATNTTGADGGAEATQKVEEGKDGEGGPADADQSKSPKTSLSYHLRIDQDQNVLEIDNKISVEEITAGPPAEAPAAPPAEPSAEPPAEPLAETPAEPPAESLGEPVG